MKNKVFNLVDAELIFYPTFFNQQESSWLFDKLVDEIKWRNGQIKLFGKLVGEPRQTAFYGDKGLSYTYSGKIQQAEGWTESLLAIKEKLANILMLEFNSVLANLYRCGKDSMGWHSDNEKELGQNPIIASVSFGVTRIFRLKHVSDSSLCQNIELTNGSLLLMKGSTQHFWKHQIPKTNKVVEKRINLTFRNIIT